MQGETIEVHRMPVGLRIYTVVVLFGCAALFAWLGWAHPSEGVVFGWLLTGVLLWATLYVLRLPDLVVTADDYGVTYVDGRLGLLFVFGEGRAAWTDVLVIKTVRVVAKGGSFLRTHVTVRAEDGASTRRFTVTSRARGYAEFIRKLDEATRNGAAERQGLPLDGEHVGETLAHLRSARRRVALVMAVLAVLLVLVVLLTKR